MLRRSLTLCIAFASLAACSPPPQETAVPSTTDEAGVQRITIQTPVGEHQVWTQRFGDNPKIKLLLLHGGPGATAEYFEILDRHFSDAGIEFYHYDQLGSFRSDQPEGDELWEIPRFVDEVEQVRKALGLEPDNFYLLGHSWGGILAIEYALAHQENLKGLIISNMMSSCPDYDRYANEVLGPLLPPEVLTELMKLEEEQDFDNPRYEELLMEHFYPKHVLRQPVDAWPPAVLSAFEHTNKHGYVLMQGPSEFGISGRLATWDRSADLKTIDVPTLVIGAANDTMDPEHMMWMAGELPLGRYLHCPTGGHMAMWDDEEIYATGVIKFLRDVHSGTYPAN